MAVRRKVFVSYHHDQDESYYDSFVNLFSDTYEIVHDNSVRQEIQSDDSDYVIRRIRESYLTGSSVTIVLCGAFTWQRKFVDWEIYSSLNQEMGLIGINLPTNYPNSAGQYTVPARLHDNVVSGYGIFEQWNTIVSVPTVLLWNVVLSLQKSKKLIDNSQPRKLRNG